jgi:murein L,D-transpeptidase YafK
MKTFALIILSVVFFTFSASSHADTRIVICKKDRVLKLFQNGKQTRQYNVCLGYNPNGPKTILGDGKTPEGEYFICFRNGASQYRRFMGISYPGIGDAEAAFEKGIIKKEELDEIIKRNKSRTTPLWDTKLGGWVGIHGYPELEPKRLWMSLLHPKPDNWTDGCIAMWTTEIEELFEKAPLGTKVIITP